MDSFYKTVPFVNAHALAWPSWMSTYPRVLLTAVELPLKSRDFDLVSYPEHVVYTSSLLASHFIVIGVPEVMHENAQRHPDNFVTV
jgi:hypothetical protein